MLVKILTRSIISLALVISQNVSADSFGDICSGNGFVYSDVKITSVIIMTGESSGNPKRVYIYTNKSDGKVFASKDLRTADRADLLMASNAQLAYLMGSNVDLCVTGGGGLYGVRLK